MQTKRTNGEDNGGTLSEIVSGDEAVDIVLHAVNRGPKRYISVNYRIAVRSTSGDGPSARLLPFGQLLTISP